MRAAPSSRRLSLPPRRIGGLLGLLLGAALGALIPSVAPWLVDRTQGATPACVLVGALAAGVSGWTVGSMVLRHPVTACACGAVFTYVFGILLFPMVAAVASLRESWGVSGPGPDGILSAYYLTPVAVIVDLPVFVLVVPGITAWALIQRRLVTLIASPGRGSETRPNYLWAWASDEPWDEPVTWLGVTVTLLAVGLGAVGLWLLSIIKVMW